MHCLYMKDLTTPKSNAESFLSNEHNKKACLEKVCGVIAQENLFPSSRNVQKFLDAKELNKIIGNP